MGSFRTGGWLQIHQERIVDISNFFHNRKREATEKAGRVHRTGGICALIPCPRLSDGEWS